MALPPKVTPTTTNTFPNNPDKGSPRVNGSLMSNPNGPYGKAALSPLNAASTSKNSDKKKSQ